MIRNWLITFCSWLLGRLHVVILPVPPEVQSVLPLARTLCQRWESHDSAGEYKRDRVYEQLLNTYPNVKPIYLYLAIILARL